MYKHLIIQCTVERLAPRLNGGNSGNIEYSYIGMSSAWEYSYTGTLCITVCLSSSLLKCKLSCSARAKLFINIIAKSMLFIHRMYSTVYRSNVLALYSFYSPVPKCITQSKRQRSQINFAKGPNLALGHRSGQHCSNAYFQSWHKVHLARG